MRLRRKKKDADADVPVVETTTDSTRPSKKGIPKIALVLVLVIVILGGGFIVAKKTFLKPQPETAVAAAPRATTPVGMNAEAGASTSAAPTAIKSTDDSRQITFVRAGLYKCSPNRSNVYMVRYTDEEGVIQEKELYLAGVGSFHYGPVTAKANEAANALMVGKSGKLLSSSHEDHFKIEGAVVALSDGHDAATLLAEKGLVQQDDGASPEVQNACKRAQEAKKGIFGLF